MWALSGKAGFAIRQGRQRSENPYTPGAVSLLIGFATYVTGHTAKVWGLGPEHAILPGAALWARSNTGWRRNSECQAMTREGLVAQYPPLLMPGNHDQSRQ